LSCYYVTVRNNYTLYSIALFNRINVFEFSTLKFSRGFNFKEIFSDIESFLSDKSLIFITEYAICSRSQVRSIFILFVPSQSIEANNRPRGQSEGRGTLIYQCWRCCQRAFIARVSEGAFRARLFSTFRFLRSTTRGGKIHRGSEKVKEWEK